MGNLSRELSNNPSTREQQLFEWHVYAESLAKMKGTDAVYDELLSAGLSEENAEEVITYANRRAVAPVYSEGTWNIQIGALLAAGGAAVTGLTYAGAMYLGTESFVIAHGAVVGGIIQFSTGLHQREQYRKAMKVLDEAD